MTFRKFLTSIGFGTLKVDTVIERPHLDEGETLNGTIYFYGGDEEQDIEYVDLKVIKLVEEYRVDSDFDYIETVVGKQSIEFAGSVKSKETIMKQFEIVPDERWLDNSDKSKLILRTIVHIDNGVDVQDEDEITYGKKGG